MTRTPRFGVNYVPRDGWFYSWLEPDLDEARRDMAAIASLGLDHVRIFPLWPVLQPNRTLIRPKALADVRRLVEVAGEEGLDAAVDVIQGHMSSYDFLPAWLGSWHARNMFTDPEAVRAQADLTRALHGALADLPNYFALTLGNEVNQFSGDPHPTPMRSTRQEAGHWIDSLLQAVPPESSQYRLHAEYDAVWYLDDHPFVPAHAAQKGDMTVLHSWIFNGTAQRYGGMSAESLRHGEYLTELAAAFARDENRPVWLQEIGAPLNCLDESDAASFCRESVRYATDSVHQWGVTWWCSHDVDRSLADFPALEYSLGLFDSAGTVKPIGRAFADVAQEIRGRERAPQRRQEAVVVAADGEGLPNRRADLAPGGSVFSTWMGLAAQGRRPARVTSGDAADSAALACRGITEVHWPADPGIDGGSSTVSDSNVLDGVAGRASSDGLQ